MSQSQATSKPLVEISIDSHPNANASPIANEDANQATAPAPDSTTAAASEVTSKRKKNYKTSSEVWQHFTKKKKGDNSKPNKCAYNYCGQEYECDSSQGTSTLKRHLEKCQKYPYSNKDKRQQVLTFSSSTQDGEAIISNWKFDPELCRKELSCMIITEELPFNFVEREGFRRFCRVLQPKFKLVSRTTIKKDCFELYTSEKNKLKDLFVNSKQRVSLTTDMWTSVQNLGFMCLTAHFIDKDWNLQKKIINFRVVPSPHSGDVIANSVELCLLEWGLENLCAVTIDNCASNDVALKNLKKKFVKKNGLLLDGEFLHMRCCAHILNLIVRDGIKEVKSTVDRIREVVKYVRSSPSRSQQFKLCCEQEKITCKKSLCLDVCTRWNSTYLMLQAALEFQKAFERLEEQDFSFKKELEYEIPDEDDWDRAKTLYMMQQDMMLDVDNNNGIEVSNSSYEIKSIHNEFQKHLEEEENAESKSELDRYLLERVEKDIGNFNILHWWKLNCTRFLVLSHVARDALAIPVSTVASESTFSGGRILDQFRSSLSPKLVESLICTKDWLRSPSTPIEIEEILEDLEDESVVTGGKS